MTAFVPDDNGVATPDPQGDTATPPEQQPVPSYAALDALIPDSEEFDEALRGKSISEINRIVRQQRSEVATANKANREERQTQLELAKTLLALKQQEAPRQAPQRRANVFIDDEQGQAIPVPLDGVLGGVLGPLQAQLNEIQTDNFFARSEAARERARAAAGVPSDVWDEIQPDLGAILQANQADTRVPNNWITAYEAAKRRAARIAGPKVTVPTMPAAPVGNATSHPAQRQAGGRRIPADEMKHIDDVAEQSGIVKGSKTYKKLLADIAAGEANV